MDTNSQTIWPPPPDIPDPLAAHDAFLTATILAPAAKPPLSRLRLVQALRKETGLDARRCLAIVNGYCERHGIFPQVRGISAWLLLMPFLLPVALLVGYEIGKGVFAREEAAASTARAMLLIIDQSLAWAKFFLRAQCLSGVASLVIFLVYSKRTRREAEEARRKVGNGLDGGATP